MKGKPEESPLSQLGRRNRDQPVPQVEKGLRQQVAIRRQDQDEASLFDDKQPAASLTGID
jgi:hypothetical protein